MTLVAPTSKGVQMLDFPSGQKPFIKHDPPMKLGEGILYRPSDNTLHYLDIERSPTSALYVAKLTEDGELAPGQPKMLEVKGSRHVTALALRTNKPGSYLCTTHSGLAYLSESDGTVEHIPGFEDIVPEQDRETMRFNDGYCDSRSHFYFHCMSRKEERKGKLYMYTKDMESKADLKVLEEGFAIGNGPVIDEERKLFYFNSTTDTIGYVYDWDPETGLISNRRENFNNSKRRPKSLQDPVTAMLGPGYPDGHTLDTEGRLYQTLYGRGCFERFLPDGTHDLTVALPARSMTCAVFGGKDMQTLYLTSASEGLQPGEAELLGDQGGNIHKIDLKEYMGTARGTVKPEFDG